MLQSIWFIVILVLLTAAAAAAAIMMLFRPDTQENTHEVWNPYATPDFRDVAGFQLVEYPDDEIAVPERFWLINGKTGAVEYTIVPDNPATLRFAPTGQLEIPDEFTGIEYELVDGYDIEGTTVKHSHNAGREGMLEWSKDGFDYVFLVPDTEMNLLGGMAYTFVTGTRAVKG